MTLLEFAGQVGGIAGVLAVIMFFIYRQDRKSGERQQLEDRKFMEDRLTNVLSDYSRDCRNHTEAFGKVREALIELTIWLKKKNGNT